VRERFTANHTLPERTVAHEPGPLPCTNALERSEPIRPAPPSPAPPIAHSSVARVRPTYDAAATYSSMPGIASSMSAASDGVTRKPSEPDS
jgi:hypothetical protein